MTRPLELHPDRLLPADPGTRAVARSIYAGTSNLPIISPHGHTDPAWFASDAPFANATELLLAPDHYLYRMLYSQGVPLADLGVPDATGCVRSRSARCLAVVCGALPTVPRHALGAVARTVFHDVFGLRVQLECGHGGHVLRPHR